ncbi:MAG: hypothetical protein NDI61_07760 [Bdellovibrionaceae bacterium]|nr:hypothetical protein [Pseudobdellovibrionaceae bacterium]
MRRFAFLIFLCAAFVFQGRPAQAKLCNLLKEDCRLYGRGRSAPTNPSKSSTISLNPSAVPTEKGFGAEVLHYDGEFDFALVRGTGRIGAAISPTNGEETFFGAPGFEPSDQFLQRKIEKKKYVSQKVSLATAFNVWSNKKIGMRRVDLNLGVLGRYNRLSKSVLPGGGISGVAGPFTFGVALSKDEYVLDLSPYGGETMVRYGYTTQTLSGGVYLSNLALDYSHLEIRVPGEELIKINLLTGTLLLKYVYLTAASRIEYSNRWAYDKATQSLLPEYKKRHGFGGVQLAATKNILIGAFYNYYLVEDISLGLTAFF